MKAFIVAVFLASLIAVITCQGGLSPSDTACIGRETGNRANEVLNNCDTNSLINVDIQAICSMRDCVRTLGDIYSYCGRSDLTSTLNTVCNGAVRMYALPTLMVATLVAALFTMF